MDFNELYSIKNEAERVNRTYDIFDEEKKIFFKGGAGRVYNHSTVY